MSILSTEDASTIAQVHAARDAELAAMNYDRLENWKRRLFRDPVDVPAPTQPPKWPAVRSSITAPANVTKLRRAG
jgi:hypothetical protein